MYIAFTLLLIVYMFLHSFLAHNKVKEYLYRTLIKERYYRIFYVSYAVFFLVPIAYFYFSAEKTLYFESSKFALISGYFLILFSIYIFYISFKNYDFKEFLGLDRMKNTTKMYYQLNTGGINKYVRHPLYSASYTLMAGIFLISPDNYILTACIVIAIYLPIGIVFEEQKLKKEYGIKYREYMERVPMLFPKINNQPEK